MRKNILFVFSLIILGWGCSGHGDHSHDEVKTEESDHTDEVVFTAEQAKAIGLETVTVEAGEFHEVIKTSGQILSAPGDEVVVSATASGIVTLDRNSLTEGLSVKRGESLLSISSQDLPDGDPGVRANAAYAIAEKEFQRAQSLIGDKLISEKEYNEAQKAIANREGFLEKIQKEEEEKGRRS